MVRKRAIVVCPESPYPVHGGGAMRTASLLEFLRRSHDLDLILFRQQNDPDPRAHLPDGLAVRTCVLDLPYHARDQISVALRNVRRLIRGRIPLVDRFSGWDVDIANFVGDVRYDLAVLEHFWTAPYCGVLRRCAGRVVLNLHNIESVLLARCATAEHPGKAVPLRRFAALCRREEARLLPQFTTVLVTSDADALEIEAIAPECRSVVYPNAAPLVPQPDVPAAEEIVFSGNLEYGPNRTAVLHFRRNVWPLIRVRHPEVRWRLIGKNHHAFSNWHSEDGSIVVTGPVEDAVREIAAARVAIAPLLSGSGTRLKIIEAWAAGVPVVSTPLGAEGLQAADGIHLLLADTPAAFAGSVARLLTSAEDRRTIGENGRKLYEDCYSWPAAWKLLQNVVI